MFVVGDPKVCMALLDVSHSQLRKLLGTPTTAKKGSLREEVRVGRCEVRGEN